VLLFNVRGQKLNKYPGQSLHPIRWSIERSCMGRLPIHGKSSYKWDGCPYMGRLSIHGKSFTVPNSRLPPPSPSRSLMKLESLILLLALGGFNPSFKPGPFDTKTFPGTSAATSPNTSQSYHPPILGTPMLGAPKSIYLATCCLFYSFDDFDPNYRS
jgi:hypothetical protein